MVYGRAYAQYVHSANAAGASGCARPVVSANPAATRRARPTMTARPGGDESVRLAVYGAFAATGRPPDASDVQRALCLDGRQYRRALSRLATDRHVVLGPDGGVAMAHPFSAVPLGFSVMGAGTLWWGGCAWDAFAVPHVVPGESEVVVATRCPACGAPHAFLVGQDEPPPSRRVAHFLVPAARIWDDVVHACANQRIFCSTACVSGWLGRTGHRAGYVMDLPTLWRLARGWYDGRMSPGYVRREPSQAREYFASVGLSGAFWGL